jgi:hypothetical protein
VLSLNFKFKKKNTSLNLSFFKSTYLILYPLKLHPVTTISISRSPGRSAAPALQHGRHEALSFGSEVKLLAPALWAFGRQHQAVG